MEFLRIRSFLLVASLVAVLPASRAQSSKSTAVSPKPAVVSNDNLQAANAAFRAGSAAYMRNDLRTAHAEFAKLVGLAPSVAAIRN